MSHQVEAPPLMLSVAAASRVLGLSPYQVKGLLDEGHLRSTMVLKRRYISAAALSEYAEGAGRETA